MNTRRTFSALLLLAVINCLSAFAQQPASLSQAPGAVPPLVNFASTLTDINSNPIVGVTGVTFLLYKDQGRRNTPVDGNADGHRRRKRALFGHPRLCQHKRPADQSICGGRVSLAGSAASWRNRAAASSFAQRALRLEGRRRRHRWRSAGVRIHVGHLRRGRQQAFQRNSCNRDFRVRKARNSRRESRSHRQGNAQLHPHVG